jgi:hypothetical protein
MPAVPNLTTNVLLRSEETGGQVLVTEIVIRRTAPARRCTGITSTKPPKCSRAS